MATSAGLAAVVLGRMATERSRFWSFHDALMQMNGRWSLDALNQLAGGMGISAQEFAEARQAPKYLMAIKADAERARRFGVSAPPVYFINGKYMSGTFGFERLRSAVQAELRSVENRSE